MAALRKVVSITSRPNLLTLVGSPRKRAFEVVKVKNLPRYPAIVPGNSTVQQFQLLTKHFKPTKYRVNVGELSTPAMYKTFPLRAALSPSREVYNVQCLYASME